MRFNFILAAIMAMFTFAVADQTITQYVQSTKTITMTLTNYNATTTKYYATGTGGSTSVVATTYSKPSLSASGIAPSTYVPGNAASSQHASMALAGLIGLAAIAFTL